MIMYQMANGQVDWLEKNKLDLESEYPQIASFEFQTLQSQKGLNLTMTEFRGVLEKIDKAFRPPPPTAQNATQVSLWIITCREYLYLCVYWIWMNQSFSWM